MLRIFVLCQAVIWQLSFLQFFYKESRMMRLCSMVLVALFAVSLAGSAWAAEGAKKKEGGAKKGEAKKVSMEDRFAKMDKNGDKKLDMDEFKQVVGLSRQCTDLWKEVLEIASNTPSPLTFFDGTIQMGPAVVLRGELVHARQANRPDLGLGRELAARPWEVVPDHPAPPGHRSVALPCRSHRCSQLLEQRLSGCMGCLLHQWPRTGSG